MYLQKDLHIWLVFVILCYDLVIQKVSIEGKSMEILYPISSLKVPKVNWKILLFAILVIVYWQAKGNSFNQFFQNRQDLLDMHCP